MGVEQPESEDEDPDEIGAILVQQLAHWKNTDRKEFNRGAKKLKRELASLTTAGRYLLA